MSNKGMEKLEIYRFQAEEIEDCLRIVANHLESHTRETCMDRNVMQSYKMIQNVLNNKIDDSTFKERMKP